MSNKELDRIIKEIQKKTGKSIKAIAEDASIDRSYLSSTINDEKVFELEDAYIGKIAKAFPSFFEKQQNPTQKGDGDIVLSLNEIRDYVIAILTGQMAGNEVIMGSLDRLEKNPKGSLSAEADRLALQLAQRMKAIQKGNREDIRKKGK
jgi:transcriptional regulator with XRE-family HTH domain